MPLANIAAPDIGSIMAEIGQDKNYMTELMRYHNSAGLDRHRQWLSAWLSEKGIQCKSNDFTITCGGQHAHRTMRALERDVLGCDFGGTSWTTRSQADKIPAALGLTPGTHLLEIGAGTGWPGIYMAGLTGCDVTLLAIPVNSLRSARQRAANEKLKHQCQAVATSGTALPFGNDTFEAIGHSDVLCCLPDKLLMLEECRRVALMGSRMLFYVIAPNRHISAIKRGLLERELYLVQAD